MNGQPWIYIVLLGMVIALFSRMKSKKAGTATTAPSVREMEETLEHFAAEIEQENDKLLQAISQMKQEHAIQTQQMTTKVNELEKRCYDLSQEVSRLSLQAVQLQTAHETAARDRTANHIGQAAALHVSEPPPAKEPDSLMQMKTRYPAIFELYGQGKSVDVIAKKLGMNKGEVSLILQLARQEENARV